MSSNTLFTNKEKEMSRDQIVYSGAISLGGTILAIGIGIVITLISSSGFQPTAIFEDITSVSGMQKIAFLVAGSGYVII
jgi:hypothetical protein